MLTLFDVVYKNVRKAIFDSASTFMDRSLRVFVSCEIFIVAFKSKKGFHASIDLPLRTLHRLSESLFLSQTALRNTHSVIFEIVCS